MKKSCLVTLLICTALLCSCSKIENTADATSVSSTAVTSEAFSETSSVSETSEETVTEISPEPWEYLLSDGIFAGQYSKAYEKLLTMSDEEKTGQLLLARCPVGSAAEDAASFHLGGYILFKRNVTGKTPETLSGFIGGFQSAADIPMICAADEEGGTVVRISGNTAFRSERFPSPSKAYKSGGYEAIYSDYSEKSKFLMSLGVNLNLAPVADVSVNSSDYIYDRTLGLPAEETAEYIRNAVTSAKAEGISSCLKHFPGYGNNDDTHTGIAVDERPHESFSDNDLLPFEAGIEAGAETVLVSHNIVNAFDSERPASLSPAVHDLLRNDLDFSGVILTDDLSMDAITLYCGDQGPYADAVNAGNDMLIVTDYQAAYNDILSAVKCGYISEETLDRAVMRILAWKYTKGLIDSE